MPNTIGLLTHVPKLCSGRISSATLTSVIIRENDNLDSLKRKVAIATKIELSKLTMTNFGRLSELSPDWDKNVEENLLDVKWASR